MFIPGLKNSYLAIIIVLEISMISFRALGYGPASAVFGLISVATVAYFHLKLVNVKVRPFLTQISEEDRGVEIKWLLVIAPIVIMWINSVPIAGKFPVDYSIDIWKMLFFFAVIIWFAIEGAFRIRF